MHLGNNGRPFKLSPSLTQFFAKEIKLDNKISVRKLARNINDAMRIKCSHNSVRNYLNKINLFSFPIIKKPFLKPVHIKKRYEASKR